jgi:hypothetical protein
MDETQFTVTEQLDALIAEYGSARDALNHTLGKLEAAQGELAAMKEMLHRAELAADGWTPASDPPKDCERGGTQRDVMVKTEDGEIFYAWRGRVTGNWYYGSLDTIITPVAWKELE